MGTLADSASKEAGVPLSSQRSISSNVHIKVLRTNLISLESLGLRAILRSIALVKLETFGCGTSCA